MYNKDCLPVTHDTIEGAVQWLWGLDRLAPVSKTATCEAVVKALQDRNVGPYYSIIVLVTEIANQVQPPYGVLLTAITQYNIRVLIALKWASTNTP